MTEKRKMTFGEAAEAVFAVREMIGDKTYHQSKAKHDVKGYALKFHGRMEHLNSSALLKEIVREVADVTTNLIKHDELTEQSIEKLNEKMKITGFNNLIANKVDIAKPSVLQTIKNFGSNKMDCASSVHTDMLLLGAGNIVRPFMKNRQP